MMIWKMTLKTNDLRLASLFLFQAMDQKKLAVWRGIFTLLFHGGKKSPGLEITLLVYQEPVDRLLPGF